MEDTTKETPATKTVPVELSPEQYAFLADWQKTHEQELGIEVPIGALVRKAVDGAMKSARQKDERPPKNDRPTRPDRPMGRGGDRPDFKSGGLRKSFGPPKPFGARPSAGRGGPKFDMLGAKNKTRTFNK